MDRDFGRAIAQLKLLKKYGKDMRLAAEGWKNDYETLISIILSARTKDEVTISVSNSLFEKYPSIEELAKADLKDIEKIIKPVNFYKTKSKNIIGCAKIISEKYDSKIPVDFKRLVSLPGVGRKTANVFLSMKGKDEIGIDTHVFQISRKLGWTKNKDIEKIELDIKRLFPKKYWKQINPILVRFGKTFTSRKQKSKILEKIRNLK